MPKKQEQPISNQQAIYALSDLVSRSILASGLGLSFGGDRNLYTALGYKKELAYADYRTRYDRDPIAAAIVDEPVDSCWSEFPGIIETDEADDTEFEKALDALNDRLKLLSVFSRADRLACIGQYSVLLLGFNDGADLASEVKKASELLYITPYDESAASISQYDTSTSSPRYGLPVLYTIKTASGINTTISKSVHYSRVVHIAEGCLENVLLGTPKLKRAFNFLQSLELVAGSSAEMFYRGAFPGYGFKTDQGASMSDAQKEALKDEIEEYLHGLKRYIRLNNISVEDLAMQVADPSGHIDKLLDLIAAGARMPKRIMMGSERGELASSQDERAWREFIKRRRQLHCEPVIIRATIDRLISAKVLPEPKTKYSVGWSDLLAPTEKEIAEVANLKAQALVAYANSNLENYIPFELFTKFLGALTDDQIKLLAATMVETSPDLNPDKSSDDNAE